MQLDVDRLRSETAGCQGELVHYNNAGASLMPVEVCSAVSLHFELESRIGGYEAAELQRNQVAQIYVDIARLINAAPDEIALLSNATQAWQAVFYSMGWQPGEEVITARSEYNSNMIAFRHAADRFGIKVSMIPDAPDGTLDLAALDRMVTKRTRLIAVSHMPTNEGLVHPVEEVGRLAQAHNIPFLLDACQSVGQMPIDVKAIGCTMLSATGRKYLRAPRGTGFLWMRKDLIARTDPHVLDTRSARWNAVDGFTVAADAKRFELWENNVAAHLGLGAACRYALNTGVEAIWDRVRQYGDDLRARLKEMPGISVHDRGPVRSGIVTFSHDRLPAEQIVGVLRHRWAINTSLSDTQLTRDDLIGRGITKLVRASVHAFNSQGDLDRFTLAMKAICASGAKRRSPRTYVAKTENRKDYK